jgi:hypothetical protein
MINRLMEVILSPLIFAFETTVEIINYLITGEDSNCDEIIAKFLLK